MKPWAKFIHGGIVGLVLLAPSTASPAVKDMTGSVTREVTPKMEESSATTSRADVDAFPGRTYGDLDGRGCLWELEQRSIPFERYGHARGVETPVRLVGALHGVLFRTDTIDWETSAKREVLDCRLVLALDDLAEIVAKHGVTEVVHYGIYRGDVPLPKHGRPRHHVAALAIDLAELVKEDGTRLAVRRDWAGYVGARTCVEGARPTASSEVAIELRGILCEVAKDKLFHQVLTPNHNAQHRDHFHLEVMRDTSWTMIE